MATKRMGWIIVALAVFAVGTAVYAIVSGQGTVKLGFIPEHSSTDVYYLLVNSDGKSRIAELEAQIAVLTAQLGALTTKVDTLRRESEAQVAGLTAKLGALGTKIDTQRLLLVDPEGRSVASNLLTLMHWEQAFWEPAFSFGESRPGLDDLSLARVIEMIYTTVYTFREEWFSDTFGGHPDFLGTTQRPAFKDASSAPWDMKTEYPW